MKKSSLSCRRLQPLDELIRLDGNNVQHGAIYFWLRAIQQNEWRWWLMHSASQFALIYCYPGALYVLIVLDAGLPRLGSCTRSCGGLEVYCHRKVAGIKLLCRRGRYPADAAPNPSAAKLYAD